MAIYRLYCLQAAGGVRLADWIEADTDDEAVAKARQIEHGAVRCEVWREKQLVAKLDAHDLTS